MTDGGVAVDLTGATELTILLGKPSERWRLSRLRCSVRKPKESFAATPAPGDLDEAGLYLVQVRLVLPAWSGHSDKRQLRVYDNVE